MRLRRPSVAIAVLGVAFGCDAEPLADFPDQQWTFEGAAVTGSSMVDVILTRPDVVQADLEAIALSVIRRGQRADLGRASTDECVSRPNPDAATIVCMRGILATSVSPGDTLHLEGRVQSTGEISGTTVVPFLDLQPVDRVVLVDTARGANELVGVIDLNKVSGTEFWVAGTLRVLAAYGPESEEPLCDQHLSPSFPFPVDSSDATVRFVLPRFRCAGAWDSAGVALEVSRFDENISQFLDAASVDASPASSFGIQGAWGYWGSVTTVSIPLTVMPR